MEHYEKKANRREEILKSIEKQEKIMEGLPEESSLYKTFYERLAEVSKAKGAGDYARAYDLADKLLDDMNKHQPLYPEKKEDCVMDRIFEMLEEQYKDAIITKYNKFYNDILKFESTESYRTSGYPGTYKEFVKVKAIDALIKTYENTRYGGYMHVIVMRILNNYFEQQRENNRHTDR